MNQKTILSGLFSLFISFSVLAQKSGNYPTDYFQWPLDIPIILSGTFGELRGNHFHGGIDIKTQGSEGKKVLAAADGYIARIKVSPWGYGKAIYIQHPNGYMTVYAHLQRFNKEIEDYVQEAQYNQERFEVELFPSAAELPVKSGEFIALSGNTGGSGGPHLHFEIRDQGGERALNPLLFGFEVKDSRAPDLLNLLVYEVDSNKRIIESHQFPLIRGSQNNYHISGNPSLSFSNNLAFGLHLYDRQDMAVNKNGAYSVALYHEDSLHYIFQADGIRFDQSRFINAHIDYALKMTLKRTAHRLYEPSFYLLDAHPVRNNRGVLELDSGLHQIKLVAADKAGNESQIQLNLHKRASGTQNLPYYAPSDRIWQWDQPNGIHEGDFSANIAAKSLYQDEIIDFKREESSCIGCLSPVFHLGSESIPVHTRLYLNIRAEIPDFVKAGQVVMVEKNGLKWTALKTNYTGDAFTASTRNFGAFSLQVDSTAPTAQPISFIPDQQFRGSQLRIKVQDDLSGIAYFRALLNGKWILLEYEPKDQLLFHTFGDRIQMQSGDNVLRLYLRDEAGNNAEFVWTLKK